MASILDVVIGAAGVPNSHIAQYGNYLVVAGHTSQNGVITPHARGYLVDLTTFTQVNKPTVNTDPQAPDIALDETVPFIVIVGNTLYAFSKNGNTLYKRSLPDFAELASLELPNGAVMAKATGDYLYVIIDDGGPVV